jgi:hydrogenase-4 component F
MAIALFVAPLLFALCAWLLPSARLRPWIVPLGAAVHLALVIAALAPGDQVVGFAGWLRLDQLGRIALPLVSGLFTACSLYVPAYLRIRRGERHRIFCGALLAFLSMMSLIILSHHLGLMWVALEANTLVSAPLLYFNRNRRSLEATWKYLLIGSVGIALALLGSFFLAYSALPDASLVIEDLVREASAHSLSLPWLHTAFVVLFVGYGTKMGLAPMHTWKPDAYGEAPGLVGALLAGGLTTCAFVALLRFYQICAAAGEAAFAQDLMVAIGLLSMAVAGVFMARQRDFKRMLAYSSVEHMGILVLGIGIGGLAAFGALLHLINNALTKGVMFMAAANIHRAYASKTIDGVTGALRRVPVSGALFLAGFFAVTGTPPFGPFISEFTILRGIVEAERYGVAAAFLILLFVVFVGMGGTVLAVVQGTPKGEPPDSGFKDSLGTVGPALVLLAVVVLLGLWVPPALDGALADAARFVETGQ